MARAGALSFSDEARGYNTVSVTHRAQRSALVVAPTLDLMNQWYDVLVTAFGEKVGQLGGGYHEPGDLSR